MIISKRDFPVLDLEILMNEVEEMKFYKSKVIYCFPLVSFDHKISSDLQDNYKIKENLILKVFNEIIEIYWPCLVILPNNSRANLIDKDNFVINLILSLRELDEVYFNASFKLNFILSGLSCIFHVGYDLKIIIYYKKESKDVELITKMFENNGFLIE